MKKTIILLSILLIASNLYWVSIYPDTETTAMKYDSELTVRDESMMYLLELLPKTSKNIKKENIISISKKLRHNEFIIKNDCYWFMNVGFKFDRNDNLINTSHKLYSFQDNGCRF